MVLASLDIRTFWTWLFCINPYFFFSPFSWLHIQESNFKAFCFSFFVSSPPAPSISPSLNFCVSGSPDLFLSAFLPYVTPCASLSSMSASLWGCPSPPFCSHPPLSAHRREQQPCGPGDTPSLVARVLGPGRGCGLITLMVSAVGTQPAQEMGHLSLLELIAACGHFSPAAFRRRAERGERGSEMEARGKRLFTNFLALMSSFSLTVLPVSSSSSKGL